jgi:transposase, IS5 family
LLGQWRSLSGPALEVALRVRIGCAVFCGLDLASDMPDGTTLCRFRNRMAATGKLPLLLPAVNAQLQADGLMGKAPQGAVLDATLVQSAARPRGGATLETGSQPGAMAVEPDSADTDATWLKKGKKPRYGYRSYVTVGQERGYVRGAHGAPANGSEAGHFEAALKAAAIEAARVLADKGYAGAANRSHLKQRQQKPGIMHKAARNRPLTDQQKALYRRAMFRDD